MNRIACVGVVLVLACGLAAGPALGSVVQMRDLVAAEPSLVHQYTFEGASDTARQEDKVASGAVHLLKAAYGSGSTGAISFDPGWDSSSTAVTPQRISTTGAGAGLRTTGNIAIGSTLTVEALLRPQNLEPGGSQGYGVMSGGWPSRGYFLMQTEQSGDDSIATTIGDSFTQPDNRRQIINPFTPGHWYYVAATYSHDGSNTTIDTWRADLTAGEATLTQVQNNAVASGIFGGSNRLGVGIFSAGGTLANEAFSGSLDEVALYSAPISQATLQAHLEALVAPPTTTTQKMRHAVAGTPGLVHHYTFDGATLAERLQDKVASGGVDLQAAAYGSAGDVNAIGYAPGLDPATYAVTTQRLSRTSSGAGGAGLRSVANVPVGSTLTVEALVCPQNLESGGAVGYGVMGRGSPSRGYFITQIEESGDDSLATIIGDSFTQPDNRRELLDPFVPGHWYYVANTYEVVGGNTVINSYIADVTAGEIDLTHVLDNVTASGTMIGTDRLGIGGAAFGTSFQEAWAGSLDEVALYDRLLTRAELQDHLYLLHDIPEPATLGLLAAGTLGLLARRRRRT